MGEWKDETSYSRGERGKVEPQILVKTINGVRVIIHRHIYYKDTWLLSCNELNIDNKNLDTNDFEVAKEKAKEVLINKVDQLVKFKDEVIKEF